MIQIDSRLINTELRRKQNQAVTDLNQIRSYNARGITGFLQHAHGILESF